MSGIETLQPLPGPICGDMMWCMKTTRTGYWLLGLILASSVVLSAQRNVRNRPRRTTFASPDGIFRFKYSDSLVSCRRDPKQPDRWAPDECKAFTPVCSDFSCDSAGTVACIAYPASGMKGTTFQAGAFSVSELKEANTEAKCLKVEEPPPHVGKSRSETVNGVRFRVTETDGIATGNLMDGYVYRSFHRNKCYELDIRIASSNPAYADPGAMKNFDLRAVHRRLKQVLDTFEFTK
jgi:hypothetical protein